MVSTFENSVLLCQNNSYSNNCDDYQECELNNVVSWTAGDEAYKTLCGSAVWGSSSSTIDLNINYTHFSDTNISIRCDAVFGCSYSDVTLNYGNNRGTNRCSNSSTN